MSNKIPGKIRVCEIFVIVSLAVGGPSSSEICRWGMLQDRVHATVQPYYGWPPRKAHYAESRWYICSVTVKSSWIVKQKNQTKLIRLKIQRFTRLQRLYTARYFNGVKRTGIMRNENKWNKPQQWTTRNNVSPLNISWSFRVSLVIRRLQLNVKHV